MTAAGIKDPPTSLWGILKSIGPGLILTANIVGTGELIATTRLGSRVGFMLLWFIVVSCLIKVFCQVELGRYAIVKGEGSLEALNGLPGPRFRISWALWLWVIMYFGTLCQMAGMVGGIAELFAPQQAPAHAAWALATVIVCAVPLILGRYGLVEKFSTLMVVLFTLSNLVAVALLQGTDWRMTGSDVSDGFRFRVPASLAAAFAAFGITGVGAAELIFYPLWCLEKGYARAVGPADGTPEWEARARGWMRVMRVDAWLSMVVYTVGTLCFYILGAAILHRQGKTVDTLNPMNTLSEMYTRTFGSWGMWIWYVGAFMVLFSTYFVSTASNARLFADGSSLLGIFRFGSPEARARMIRFGIVGIALYTLTLYLLTKATVKLVLVGAITQAFMLPFLAFAAVYYHKRAVPPALRSGPSWNFLLFLSFAVMALLGIYQAGDSTKLWKALGLFQ